LSVRSAAITVVDAALAALEAERGVINDLNVYPVPDGDTGTNLALTVRAILEELQLSHAETVPDVAAAVTKGSLMGARGNSGVILSQIVRGVCEVWGRSERLTTKDFKEALAEAAASAYRAVKVPVEGTMLTVMREMAEAGKSVPDTHSVGSLLVAVEETGRVAVEHTTEQLAALRKAGVVDAGGYGLLVIFRGMAAGMAELTHSGGQVGAARVALRSNPGGGALAPTAHEDAELSAFRYCTSLLIRGEALDAGAFEEFLQPLGDSALAVGDDRLLKVHVHTNDPGVVLTEALKHGTIGEIEINDMHEQTKARDVRLRQQAELTGTVVVAVVAGEGNKALFTELGCSAVVDGGQSMNPSAAQLLRAVEDLGADEVVLLPNNGNVILTAEQAAGMSSRNIAVVPCKSIPLGLSAMVAFDAETDAVGNARLMQDALQGVQDAEVTRAVRDSELDGLTVKKGQAMGLVNGKLVAAEDDIAAAFAAVLEAFAAVEAEVVTVLVALNGSGVTVEQLEQEAARVVPDAEVHFHEGGQPLYPILASAE
jgi:uncharacterized protein